MTYAHEHLILDSPLIAAVFPHIRLDDASAAISEVARCRDAGVKTMVDAMPCSAGRDVVRLAEISLATGANPITTTGLHHERYSGARHCTARIGVDTLAQLFIDDLVIGVDEFDYPSPILQRTEHRAGIIKVSMNGGKRHARGPRVFEDVG